jgi:hypothetical protein
MTRPIYDELAGDCPLFRSYDEDIYIPYGDTCTVRIGAGSANELEQHQWLPTRHAAQTPSGNKLR